MCRNAKPAAFLFYLMIISIVALAAVFIMTDGGEVAAPASVQTGRVLIIDPGHGGADGGAVSPSGSCESAINLKIALVAKALADFTATPCVLTRDGEELEYPPEADTIAKKKVADQKSRVALVNSIPGAVLLSVHQNKYTAPQPRGPHVFYRPGGEPWAEISQEYLNAALYPDNRRVAAPVADSIFLFKSVDCPAVLAECGFLSNPEEAALLETGKHQVKASVALICAYLSWAAQS